MIGFLRCVTKSDEAEFFKLWRIILSLDKENVLFENKYLDQTDNVFEAINTWYDESCKLNSKYQGRLLDSEALSYSLIDKIPDDVNCRKFVKFSESSYKFKYIEEALNQIDDKDIKLAVNKSLYKSIKEKNLVFDYLKILTEAQKARVRIICRMVWYNLYPKKGI